ncbi:Replication factor A [Vigna unguiculata]|uniref:Replication factor A n=1 Tax=Vigna unguiculata TaxID=3917 RepID=A0A4D6KQD2_VIGUN|nr:Replication factor A [Vigna unguiculata]
MYENNESPSQGLKQLSQTSKHTVEEDFLTLTPRTTIQGLKDCKEVGTYILFGTIKHILGEDDWWYTACVCNKSVYPDSKMFFCENCNKHVIKVFPRYRIKIRVIDSSDSTTFVLFDRDATTIFKKTCADMLDSHDKMNASGNFPKEFDDLDDDIIQKFNDSSMKPVDVYVGNGEFSRGKQRVGNESTVDIAEDLLVRFTKETIECGSQSLDLIKDTTTNEDGNNSLKREST